MSRKTVMICFIREMHLKACKSQQAIRVEYFLSELFQHQIQLIIEKIQSLLESAAMHRNVNYRFSLNSTLQNSLLTLI